MTLIRVLPDEFSVFASSLLLLDKLEKSTIHQAFVTEESQCRHRASHAPNVSSALAASSSSSAASATPQCERWRVRVKGGEFGTVRDTCWVSFAISVYQTERL
jgi:hypothetical protein